MIQINKSRNIFLAVAASALFLVILTAGFILSQRMASAAPATINVTMFAHEDSHPDLGDGCSLYEASIAANTATAYGGCEPGSVDGTTIVLGAGDYTHEEVDGVDIVLDNTSLVGTGTDQTIVNSAYTVNLIGDEEATVEGLTIVSPAETDASPEVRINGSNKILDDLIFDSADGAPGLISLATYSWPVANITISNIYMSQQGVISCYDEKCSGVTVDNVEISGAGYNSVIYLDSSANSTVSNVSLNTTNNVQVSVGPNSFITNLDMNIPVCGGMHLNLNEGTVVDGLSQTMGQGCAMNMSGDADKITNVYQSMPGTISSTLNAREVSNYEVDAGGFYWTNNYVGSEVSDVEVNVDVSGSALNMAGSKVSGVSIEGSGSGTVSMALFDTYDGMVVSDVTLENQNYVAIASIASKDAYVDGLSLSSSVNPYDGSLGYVYLSDAGSPSISNINMEGARLRVAYPVDLDLNNVTVRNFMNSFGSEAVTVTNLTGHATLSDINITDSIGGISVQGAEDSSLAIDNVQIENITNPTGETQEAIALYGIGRSSVSNTTISRALTNSTDQSSSVVSIVDGLEHFIVNMTISNSNSGVTAVGGEDMNVSLNNVTIANNEDGPDHSSSNPYALRSYGLGTLNVNNSIIGGSSPYTGCFNDGATLNIANSIATHESCADFGATVVPSLEGVLATSLAGNGSLGNAQTLALLPGDNPALLAGDSSTCESTDARGVNRPDGQCDLGAFQLSSVSQDEGGGTGTGTPSPNAPDSGLERSDSSSAVPALVVIVMLITAVGVYRRLV